MASDQPSPLRTSTLELLLRPYPSSGSITEQRPINIHHPQYHFPCCAIFAFRLSTNTRDSTRTLSASAVPPIDDRQLALFVLLFLWREPDGLWRRTYPRCQCPTGTQHDQATDLDSPPQYPAAYAGIPTVYNGRYAATRRRPGGQLAQPPCYPLNGVFV